MTTPNGPGGFGDSAAGDPLPEATTLVRGAAAAGQQIKILAASGYGCCAPTSRPGCAPGRISIWPAWARTGVRSPTTWKARAASPTSGSTT